MPKPLFLFAFALLSFASSAHAYKWESYRRSTNVEDRRVPRHPFLSRGENAGAVMQFNLAVNDLIGFQQIVRDSGYGKPSECKAIQTFGSRLLTLVGVLGKVSSVEEVLPTGEFPELATDACALAERRVREAESSLHKLDFRYRQVKERAAETAAEWDNEATDCLPLTRELLGARLRAFGPGIESLERAVRAEKEKWEQERAAACGN